jgi:hypothetical protein
MTLAINRFALEKHDGPYKKWPLKSRLIVDGVKTETKIPGYSLLHQFETNTGYLLVTDYDCPFEEATDFSLLDREFSLLAHRSIGAMYCSFLLEKIEWLDENNLIATFYQDDHWKISIELFGGLLSQPRISAKPMSKKTGDF